MKFQWFVVFEDNSEMRRNSTMRGRWPGNKVVCSCGWTNGGYGVLRGYVEHCAEEHLYDEHYDEWKRRDDARHARFMARADESTKRLAEMKAQWEREYNGVAAN